MKLWDILKEENTGKKYKDNTGMVYRLGLNEYEQPTIYDCADVVSFSQSELLSLEFEEVGTWTGWERAAKNELYYYIDVNGISERVEENHILDDRMYDTANYFSNKRTAEEVSLQIQIIKTMIRFYELNDDNVNWEDLCYKYYITLSEDKEQVYSVKRTKQNRAVGVVYFSSKELAQECINKVLIHV